MFPVRRGNNLVVYDIWTTSESWILSNSQCAKFRTIYKSSSLTLQRLQYQFVNDKACMKPHRPHCWNKPFSSKCLRTGVGAVNWKLACKKRVPEWSTHNKKCIYIACSIWQTSLKCILPQSTTLLAACLFTRRPWRMQRLANLQFSALAMHWFLKPVDAWYVNIGSLCPNTSSRRYQVVTKSVSLSPKGIYDFRPWIYSPPNEKKQCMTSRDPGYKILRTALVDSRRKEQEKQQANNFKS